MKISNIWLIVCTINWPLIFTIACNMLWQTSNEWVFDGKRVNPINLQGRTLISLREGLFMCIGLCFEGKGEREAYKGLLLAYQADFKQVTLEFRSGLHIRRWWQWTGLSMFNMFWEKLTPAQIVYGQIWTQKFRWTN